MWGTLRACLSGHAAAGPDASPRSISGVPVWAVHLVSLGYFSSLSLEAFLGKVRHVEEWLAAAVAVALVIALVRRVVVTRRVRAPS